MRISARARPDYAAASTPHPAGHAKSEVRFCWKIVFTRRFTNLVVRNWAERRRRHLFCMEMVQGEHAADGVCEELRLGSVHVVLGAAYLHDAAPLTALPSEDDEMARPPGSHRRRTMS